jgi:hypothetical protein
VCGELLICVENQQFATHRFAPSNFVGEAVTHITRAALTLGGAHAIFKTSPLERCFRDGATAPIQFPPADFCLGTVGVLELRLNLAEMLPPLKRP